MRRDQKKEETRQRISNVATGMFFERGFDAVTLQEIADAAGVSKMTVLNYFARKEDLFLDRQGEGASLIEEALLARDPKHATIIIAIRNLIQRLRLEDHPFASVNPGRARFWEIVHASSSLSARARELADEEVDALAHVLARATKMKAPDANARLVAASTLTIWRTAYTEALRAMTPTRSQAKAHVVFDDVIERGFRGLSLGMVGTPYSD
jgi:AcrR family transcriptional regulator